jgi:hypothetical protein
MRRDPLRELQALSEARLSRRDFVVGAAAAPLGALLLGRRASAQDAKPHPAGLSFAPVPASVEDRVLVPVGYRADVLLAWGDPLFADAPAFDPKMQSAERQALQFGFNADFNAFVELPGGDSRGLLCTNHEYTSPGEMFQGYEKAKPTAEHYAIELAAHGMTIAEIELSDKGRWALAPKSARTRRIYGATPMRLAGPAAGTQWLKTAADPRGGRVLGTLSNCAGGKTPWGTVLTCEEKFYEYFSNAHAIEDPAVRERLKRYGVSKAEGVFPWARFEARFDLGREPNEVQRFGWVVEVDPFDARSTPVKRTALGRFAHEGAATTLAKDGRAVVYSGDDERFEYLYKFVSARACQEGGAQANRDLLDAGTLYVARFAPDGTGVWLPLVPEGALAEWKEAEILVHTRLAADALGATPMDRPEDVEVDAATGRVYVCLTNNTKREQGDGGPNPRGPNPAGHLLELVEESLAGTRFQWSVFLLGGVPLGKRAGADADPGTALACPDNLAFDRQGNLWLATDGQHAVLGVNDAVFAIPTTGPDRGLPGRFLSGPIGAELCGPEFTPDERTFFVNVQHPGEDGGLSTPKSRWPHDAFGMPRPGVLAIRREDGGVVGT